MHTGCPECKLGQTMTLLHIEQIEYAYGAILHMGPNIYVGDQLGTVPVPALDAIFRPLPALGRVGPQIVTD